MDDTPAQTIDPAKMQHVYTPAELNREVRMHLEMGFPRILLEAEVSNLSRPASGHLYFTLKDDKAQIRCALFRGKGMGKGMSLRLENGMQVLARGRISLYEPRGDFQLILDSVQEAGEGALQRQFEELKKRLDAEGLFDTARKRGLPHYPVRIGLVTSPSGAAIRAGAGQRRGGRDSPGHRGSQPPRLGRTPDRRPRRRLARGSRGL
jgi:exodeoxyribonuclease VII large subunit